MMGESLSVVHVVGSLAKSWGGLSAYVVGLASEQRKMGLAPVIVTSDPEGSAGLVPIEGIAPVHATRKSLSTLVASADVVHIHGLWIPLCHTAARLARKNRVPYVVSTHGMLEKPALSIAPWKKKIAYYLYQRRDLAKATALHGTTELECDTLRRRGFRAPVIILPPGVEPQDLSATRAGSRRKLAVFLGRIHPIKGTDLLVDAWAKISPPGWTLAVAGFDEDGHLDQLQKKIAATGPECRIEYVGPVFGAEKAALLHEASLMIQPSVTENFGISIAEGLSYGVPVITTVGTPWESLVQSRCGWWVPRTIDALADAIGEATQLPQEELDAMAARGQEMCKERFCWKVIAGRMLDCYVWVARREGCVDWIDLPSSPVVAAVSP